MYRLGADMSQPLHSQLQTAASGSGYRGPWGFVRRHYNGDYSLGRSYWVHLILIPGVASVAGLALTGWLGEEFPARYGSAGVLAMVALGIVIWFWAVAGTWASADKHVQRGGRAGWATAAKVMMVLGILRTLVDLVGLVPVLHEHLEVAMGSQLGPETRLELRADGRSILLSGGINDGSAGQLERALDMAPAVTTVVLSSDGGWIREGKLLAAVIRRHGLDTYVEGSCDSACTIAFLAGRDRAAAPTASLGFHASRSVGSVAVRPSAAETAQLRALYRDAGLPEAFITRALDTSHADMWYPPHDTLFEAGVLSRRSLGGETAALSTAVRSRDALVSGFREQEMYRALAERFPGDFDRLVEVAWTHMQQGGTDAQVIAAARVELMAILGPLMPLADDATLIAYQSLVQEQLEALHGRDVSACVEMAFPSGEPMGVVSNLPPALVAREMDLMTRVLRGADPARRVIPSEEVIDRIALWATAEMTQDELDAFFMDESAQPPFPASLRCRAAIRFVAGVNALPFAERANAIRVLYASE